MRYRFAFFNQLQERSGYDTVILFCTPYNEPPSIDETNVRYEQIMGIKFGPFNYYPTLTTNPAVRSADILVLPADLRIANNFSVSLRRIFRDHPRIIFWGMDCGRSKIARPFRRFIFKFADAVVFYSERRKRLFSGSTRRDHFFSAPNTMLIPNHGILDNPKGYLLYVGRLQQSKRIELAIKALAILHENGYELSFKIVGGGDDIMNDLRSLTHTLKLSSYVSFEGPVYDDVRLKELFSGAYAYVSPGPVGLGAIHSIAYGIPVITAKDVRHGPEFDHLVEEKSVFLCELTPTSIVDACLRVLQSEDKVIRQIAYQSFLQGCAMERMVEGFYQACEFALCGKLKNMDTNV